MPLVYNILDMAQYFEMFKEFMKTQLKNKNRDESTERNKRGHRELLERRNYDDTSYDRSPKGAVPEIILLMIDHPKGLVQVIEINKEKNICS